MGQVVWSFVALLILFLIATEVGFRFGIRSAKSGAESSEPEKIATTFVLSLLSLILAFTINSAQSHFRERAEIIVKEAQSIRAAKRALEELPDEIRSESQVQMSAYLKAKKEYNESLNTGSNIGEPYEKGRRILHEIRRLCQAESATNASDTQRAVLDRLDHVAELGLERHILVTAPHSDVVIRFLALISLIACFLLGHSHRNVGKRVWWAGFLFSSVVASTLVLALDYDSPRQGLIRVNASDALYDDLEKG